MNKSKTPQFHPDLSAQMRQMRDCLHTTHKSWKGFLPAFDNDSHIARHIGLWLLQLQELKKIMDGIEFEIEEYIQEVATESLDLINGVNEDDKDNDDE